MAYPRVAIFTCVRRPENILLKSEAEFTVLKLTDFNLSTIVGPESYRQTFCGTLDLGLILTGSRVFLSVMPPRTQRVPCSS